MPQRSLTGWGDSGGLNHLMTNPINPSSLLIIINTMVYANIPDGDFYKIDSKGKR